ncbi:hypothetical protein BDR26DRAFT_849984 [Obelidium mucronatum]|nr:hypothetical protein BDR26DRAFT_849984 [Obelidium mucronatum]
MAILNFELVGRGDNRRPSDGAIVAYAGWDSESFLEGACVLSISSPLRNVRIQAEFRGFVETRWEGLNKLATKPDSPDYKVTRTAKIFQQLVDVVYDSKSPLSPNPNGTPTSFPFRFRLPRNQLPPTFISVGGSIQYYIKCSMLYQEGMRILKSNHEIEVPIIILMPDSAKIRLYNTPCQLTQEGPANADKVHYTVSIPKVIVAVGENLEVNLDISSTPADTRLRTIQVSLRPIVSYVNVDRISAHLPFPRPMSEITESFPLVQVGNGGIESVKRKLFLEVDGTIAQPSFESPLISVRSILRIQITIDNSEVPNISKEFPIVVLPQLANPELSFNTPGAAATRGTPTRMESILDSPWSRGVSIDSHPNNNPSIRSRSPTSFVLPNPEIPLPNRNQPSGVLPPSQHTLSPTPSQQSMNPVALPSFGSPISQPVYNIPVVAPARGGSITTNSGNGRQLSIEPHSPPVSHHNYPTSSPPRQGTWASFDGPGSSSSSSTELDLQHQTPATTSSGGNQPLTPTFSLKGPHFPPPSEERIATPPPGYRDPHHEFEQDQFHHGYHEDSQHQHQHQQEYPSQDRYQGQQESPQPIQYQQQHPVQQYQQQQQPSPVHDNEDPQQDHRHIVHMASRLSVSTTDSTSHFGPVHTWSVETVAQWVRNLKAPEEVVENFISHGIEGEVLLTLDSEDLKTDLGVVQLGLRRKMTLAIEKLKAGQ